MFLLVLRVEDTSSRPGPDLQELERRDAIEPAAASDLFDSPMLLVSITGLCTALVSLLEGQMSLEAIGVAVQTARQDGD